MKIIQARNVHQALPEGLYQLLTEGVRRESRNGPVLKFDQPVTTVYERPEERVMFWPSRDANPFFHLMESLWMLGGRRDVEYVARFVSRIRSFSDDGATFHGAYGYRWRTWFGHDQLQKIVQALRADPTDRRQVLSMWDGAEDLGRQGKDLPCNLQALFSINSFNQLDMTVTNRSNDIIWGAYGANAVHFSYLQEYMARSIGVPVGRYWQVSANFHAYLETLETVKELAQVAADADLPAEMRWAGVDPYQDGLVEPFPLMSTEPASWDEDLYAFIQNPTLLGFRDPFFRKVARPMYLAHEQYKNVMGAGRYVAALSALEEVRATDWKLAAQQWVQRRQAKFIKAQDDGVAYE